MESDDLTRPPEADEPTPAVGDGDAEVAATADAPADPEAAAAKPSRPPTIGQLRRDRRKLWDERQEVVYHVGGLAVDLHRRGLVDDDSLIARRCELVVDIDTRINSIDEALTELDATRRRGRERMPAPSGYCMSCGAPYLAGAAFCSRCGARVFVPPADAPADEDDSGAMPTQVIGEPVERGQTELLNFDDQWTQAIHRHFEDGPR